MSRAPNDIELDYCPRCGVSEPDTPVVVAFVIVTFAAMAVAAHFLGFGVTLVLLWRLRRREG